MHKEKKGDAKIQKKLQVITRLVIKKKVILMNRRENELRQGSVPVNALFSFTRNLTNQLSN